MTEKRQRRTYLVNAPFQLKYILLLMAWGGLVAMVFGLWTYRAQQQAVEAVVRDPGQRAAIMAAGRQLLWALAGISALSVAALGLFGFIITHRIAGPVFVMSWFLELLGEGRFPPPRALRRHDELQGFHAQFLKAIDAMKERERAHLDRVAIALAGMRQALPRVPELGPALAGLERDAAVRKQALVEASPPTPAPTIRAAAGM